MLPPLDTPIAHDGSPECPVHPETRVHITRNDGTKATKLWAGGIHWFNVTTYTIIAYAPADQMVELRSTIAEGAARIAALEAALKPFADVEMFTKNAGDDDIVLVTVGSIRKARATLKGKTDV